MDVSSVTKVWMPLWPWVHLSKFIPSADFHDIYELDWSIQHAAKVQRWWTYQHQGAEIKINEPSKRIHIVDAIKEITGVDFWQDLTLDEAKAIAAEKKCSVEKHYTEVELHHQRLLQKNSLKKHWFNNFRLQSPGAVSPLAKKEPETHASLTVSGSSSWQRVRKCLHRIERPNRSVSSTSTSAKGAVTTEQQASTTTTLKLSDTVCHQQVDSESVSTVSARFSLTTTIRDVVPNDEIKNL